MPFVCFNCQRSISLGNKSAKRRNVKCPYPEFFWSLFSRIWTEYGNISPQCDCGKMRTGKTSNTDNFNAVYENERIDTSKNRYWKYHGPTSPLEPVVSKKNYQNSSKYLTLVCFRTKSLFMKIIMKDKSDL